jgi:hypothetical protein
MVFIELRLAARTAGLSREWQQKERNMQKND